jgi:hypothetical protein
MQSADSCGSDRDEIGRGEFPRTFGITGVKKNNEEGGLGGANAFDARDGPTLREDFNPHSRGT